MSDKLTLIAAVEKMEKLIVELKLAIDSAERYHKVTRNKCLQSTTATPSAPAPRQPASVEENGDAGDEVFARHRAPQAPKTPEAHALRMRHCQHNRETIDALYAKLQALLNDYQADLKDHHRIDEGARLLECVQAIDAAVAAGHWQQGLFFRTIGEKLKTVRERFHDSASQWQLRVVPQGDTSQADAANSGPVLHRVYVSLYQAGGQNLNNWQYMLSHLAEQTMGRPTYSEREHVDAFVRSRPVPSNEAYLVAHVLEKDIISGLGKGPTRTDSDGRAMLSLNKGAIKLENVEEFVHSTGRFTIDNGALVPLGPDTEG